MSELLVLLSIGIVAASGAPGLLLSPGSCTGQRIAAALAVPGCGLGLIGVAAFWITGSSEAIRFDWRILNAEFYAQIDGLSALFLVPIFLIALLGNIYGLDYWKQTEHPGNSRKLHFFYGTLTAGMALLVIARDSILFLFGWEIMALSAFFLVATEDHQQEVRETAWIYLVATHTATLSLFALFALLRNVTGSFTLVPLQDIGLSPEMTAAIFILSLIGFGLKAGIMPLHVWLPSAHAITPSHVSAIMSGVIIKMGIYGLVRITSLMPHPPAVWGGVVLALGAISGVLGVAYAIGQHDLKRLLAYHSIENIGIIVMGLGLALLGRSLDHPEWIVLGLGGGLLHVWNHAFFKALLFLSAGSVIHATHTRSIDRLGGLAKSMPRTAFCFLVGAVAICGLPPLNGFVSEFLIYLGLFETLKDRASPLLIGIAFAIPILALIGALALACFVKVYGAVFLGTPRSEHTGHAHEAPPSMIGPMAALMVCCTVIGLAPLVVTPVLNQAVAAAAPEFRTSLPQLESLAPLPWISIMALLLLGALTLSAVALWNLTRDSRSRGPFGSLDVTWGCGYAAPTSRMQYTSSSFAQMLVWLFAWALRPRTKQPKELPLFPGHASFHSDVPDAVLDEAVLPTIRYGAWLLSGFRVFQQGNIQSYLLYIIIVLIVLLAWR